MASLAGLEDALASDDPGLVELAIRRILLGHALVFGYDGIPLLYMGDELGLLNDHSYLNDPARAADNRWLHRPAMDWELAGRRTEPGTVHQRIFSALAALAEARRRTPQLHAATPLEVVDLQQPQLFAFMRRHPLGPLVAVHNVTEQPQHASPMALYLVGHDHPVDRITGQPAHIDHGGVVLNPYQAVWLTAPDPSR
jgi:amylosucrase